MKKSILKLNFFTAIFCILFFASCEFTESPMSEKKNWTIMVYMGADNNLATSAFKDINEMEAADVDFENVNIITLADFSSSYLSSSQAGSKLYSICKDSEGLNGKIVSERLTSRALDLSLKKSTNLNMADGNVLSDFLDYSKEYFPADHYALIVWGHGSGWRNFSVSENFSSSRAVAFDDSSMQYMAIPTLREAIEKNFKKSELDFIGFDTCFGSQLEVLYELKDCASWFAGVEGFEGSDGWNYEKWFSNFKFTKEDDGEKFALCLEDQFIEENDKTFAAVDLSRVENLFNEFESFCENIVTVVKDEESKKEILDAAKTSVISFYESGAESDYVVDLVAFSKALVLQDASYSKYSAELFDAVKESISTKREYLLDRFPIGIFLCGVDAEGNFVNDFSEYYINGSGAKNQSKFVMNSNWYVPSAERHGSLLDRLFCMTFFTEGK